MCYLYMFGCVCFVCVCRHIHVSTLFIITVNKNYLCGGKINSGWIAPSPLYLDTYFSEQKPIYIYFHGDNKN